MATIAGLLAAAAPGTGADFSNDTLWLVVLKAIGIIVFLLLSVLFAIWFERKIVARMQLRPGPNVHGPFGLFQPLADAMKLLFKEDLMVHGVDKLIYVVAPMISAFCSLLVFAVIPFGPQVSMFGIRTPLQLTDLSVSVLYILAVTSLGVYGIVLGGWASRSTYPLLGAARSTAQLISYELVMGLSLVSVFILARSMSTSRIVESQTHVWWFLPLLPAFVLYLVAMVGETNRMPFDLPEAEGELVSGYMTEYSSMKFAWFFLAEYVNMLNVSAVATTLFLGGWRAPWPLSLVGDGVLNTGWWPVLWFLAKLWLLMFVFVWLRGTLVRFRYDQFMRFSWKVLVPVGLVWVVAVATEQAILRFADVEVRSVLIVLVVVVFAAAVLSSIAPKSAEGSRQRRRKRRFDAFAGGYPVPPRPGQYLPPSPRRARMGARPVQDVVSEQVEECEEEPHG